MRTDLYWQGFRICATLEITMTSCTGLKKTLNPYIAKTEAFVEKVKEIIYIIGKNTYHKRASY